MQPTRSHADHIRRDRDGRLMPREQTYGEIVGEGVHRLGSAVLLLAAIGGLLGMLVSHDPADVLKGLGVWLGAIGLAILRHLYAASRERH